MTKSEVPSESTCSYFVELPPMAASSSSSSDSEDFSASFRGQKDTACSVDVECEVHQYHTKAFQSHLSGSDDDDDEGSVDCDEPAEKVARLSKDEDSVSRSASVTKENLPPSRYDYPAFLTIPLDQKQPKEPQISISSDDKNCDLETNHSRTISPCASSSHDEAFGANAGSGEVFTPEAVAIQIDSSIDDLTDYYDTSQKVAEVREVAEVASGENKESLEVNLVPHAIAGRRFSSGDYDRITRRRFQSSPDYDYEQSLVASKEQEYIRKHRSRNNSISGGEGLQLEGEEEDSRSSLVHQHHSATNIYMSLLNIIQQSQTLITDLTLHYQAEMHHPLPAHAPAPAPAPPPLDSHPTPTPVAAPPLQTARRHSENSWKNSAPPACNVAQTGVFYGGVGSGQNIKTRTRTISERVHVKESFV